MKLQLVEHSGSCVVECVSGITDAREAMELAFACGEAGTDLLLIDAGALPPGFCQLRTGFAGEFVQRLVNSRLRAAAVFDPDAVYPEKFREFLLEARRHPQFRVFSSPSDALAWLTMPATRCNPA